EADIIIRQDDSAIIRLVGVHHFSFTVILLLRGEADGAVGIESPLPLLIAHLDRAIRLEAVVPLYLAGAAWAAKSHLPLAQQLICGCDGFQVAANTLADGLLVLFGRIIHVCDPYQLLP